MVRIGNMARKKSMRKLISDFIETPIIFMAGPVGFILLLLGVSVLFEDPKAAYGSYGEIASYDAGPTANQTESHDAYTSR